MEKDDFQGGMTSQMSNLRPYTFMWNIYHIHAYLMAYQAYYCGRIKSTIELNF